LNSGSLLQNLRISDLGSRQANPLTPLNLISDQALRGTPAAYAVRRTWRHKTRKQPFKGRLHAIAAAQALLLATALWHLG
jgi:hypothetical protein